MNTKNLKELAIIYSSCRSLFHKEHDRLRELSETTRKPQPQPHNAQYLLAMEDTIKILDIRSELDKIILELHEENKLYDYIIAKLKNKNTHTQ